MAGQAPSFGGTIRPLSAPASRMARRRSGQLRAAELRRHSGWQEAVPCRRQRSTACVAAVIALCSVDIFRGEWMTMQRWLIATAVTCVAATGCSEAPQGTTTRTERRPQQAGPTNSLITAGHLADVEAASPTGDQRAM